MKLKNILVLTVFVFCSHVYSEGWSGYGKIELINQQPENGTGQGAVFIETTITENPSDSQICTRREGFYFNIIDGRTERIYSSILVAFMAGKEVRFYVKDNCHVWGYAELDGIIIK